MANTCKYYKQRRYVSYNSGATWQPLNEYRKGELYEYDSSDCGYYTMYQWVSVSGEYICDGTTKYQKEKKQVSTDGGQTWSDVTPLETRKGFVIEFESSDCYGYANDYLTFVALESGTFKFNCSSANTEIQYSLDYGNTWSTLASSADSPTITAGNKIMWKGELTPVYRQTDGGEGIGTFSSTNKFDVEGNAMSLLFGDNFRGQTSLSGKKSAFNELFLGCRKLVNAKNLSLPATELEIWCYHYMFFDCRLLKTIPKLPATKMADICYNSMFQECWSLTSVPYDLLPSTELAVECYGYMFSGCISLTSVPQLPATTLRVGCYLEMFQNCYSLTVAPELPATTLVIYCYYGMFIRCTSLQTAPTLPATTLADECYYKMFWNCTSLTSAPQLLATTLATQCYRSMFSGCTSLTSITCLATDISATDCTKDWVRSVASSGTFTKASSMNDWSSGDNGIPSGWTVQNYS